MAGALAPQKACHSMLAQRAGRCGRALAVAPQAVAALEAPPAKQSKPDGVMGQGPIIINGQVPLRALWLRRCYSLFAIRCNSVQVKLGSQEIEALLRRSSMAEGSVFQAVMPGVLR